MLIWVTFSDVCVQCPSCCGGTPCHRWTPGFPRKHLRFLDKKWELQGDKLVPGQDHTGRELLGWSEIIYSAPQPQGRLSSTLVPPSRCYPAVKSSRETGSAFLPSMSKYWFCFHYLTWMFLLHFKSMASLHLWPLRGDWSIFYKSLTLQLRYVGHSWGSPGTYSDLRECRPQLCPPRHCEKVWEQHQPVICPLVASTAEAEPTSTFDR